MSKKITHSVGRGGKNHDGDMYFVFKLLEIYNGRTPPPPICIPLPKLISDIESFQEKTLKLTKPDGRVDPNGKTINTLLKGPKVPMNTNRIMELRAQGSPGDIRSGLWLKALEMLEKHSEDPDLRNYNYITLIDFTKSRKVERLWVVSLTSGMIIIKTHVSHGANSGNWFPTLFQDVKGSHKSNLGSYVTLQTYQSKAGSPKKNRKRRLALIIKGLDGSNKLTKSRYIIFHGAHYMNPSKKKYGRSHGCFATDQDTNNRIINLIKNGSFVYSMYK